MLRFRLGQSWKREPARAPNDSISLEVDGVDLLAGASEEPVARVVGDLADALWALSGEGARFAQVSLSEAHIELSFRRIDTDVELTVVSLARPARLLRRPIRVDLEDLCQAAVKCGRALVKDLSDAAPELLRAPAQRKLMRTLSALETHTPSEQTVRADMSGFRASVHPPNAPVAAGFDLEDKEDVLSGFDKRCVGALGTVLCPGAVTIAVGAQPAWCGEGVPFLIALELTRQAADLSHAIEFEEPEFSFAPGGLMPEVLLKLTRRELWVGDQVHPADPAEVAQSLFQLGLSLADTIRSRNKAQAKNPYLTELVARCQEGLAGLKAVVGPVEGGSAVSTPRRTSSRTRALKVTGKLRKLHFRKLWDKHRLGGHDPGRLLLGPRGPLFSSPEMACQFSLEGELVFRRYSTHGVAASADGRVLTAQATRVCAFVGQEGSARWLRDHDGAPLGPELYRHQGTLIALSEGRAVVAYAEISGRELWRIVPPRTQRTHLAIHGPRVLLATDSGYLYGADMDSGQVRYRMRSALPFNGPAIPWGKKFIAALGRGERLVVFAADAHSGAVVWSHDLALSSPSQPLLLGNRVVVAGDQDGGGVMVCLTSRGKPLWQRQLHLGHGPYSLLAIGRSVCAVSPSGGAVLVGADGRVEWRLGSAGEDLPRLVKPRLSRGVLVVPGEVVRAVDPRGGRVLAEVRGGPGLLDVEVDRDVNLFLLDEDGTLTSYELASHLAVVSA